MKALCRLSATLRSGHPFQERKSRVPGRTHRAARSRKVPLSAMFRNSLAAVVLLVTPSPGATHPIAQANGTVCIAPFTPVARLSDAELTNKHPARDGSTFRFIFGKAASISVPAHHQTAIRLKPGKYHVRVLLDGKQAETLNIRVGLDMTCLWYLAASGWQASSGRDKAHGCRCARDGL